MTLLPAMPATAFGSSLKHRELLPTPRHRRRTRQLMQPRLPPLRRHLPLPMRRLRRRPQRQTRPRRPLPLRHLARLPLAMDNNAPVLDKVVDPEVLVGLEEVLDSAPPAALPEVRKVPPA